jgi:hypothetical protein
MTYKQMNLRLIAAITVNSSNSSMHGHSMMHKMQNLNFIASLLRSETPLWE